MATAQNLVLVADTNAVPPSGVAGIGPLSIGHLKYKTQFGLFEKIQQSPQAAIIDFPDAYSFALSVLEEQTIKLAKVV